MSKRVTPEVYAAARDRAMKSFPPAGSRQQDLWMQDWNDAVGRMQYMEVTQAGLADSLRCLYRVRGIVKRPNLSFDLIKPDVETLWNDISSQAEESFHCLTSVENGFEFLFLAIERGTYMTGSITVQRKS